MSEPIRLYALFILILFAIAQDIGDLCVLSDGSPATCKHIEACYSAQNELKIGITPIICGFSEIFPVVCCDDREDYQQMNRISDKKCAEYLQLDIRTTISTTTTTTTETVRIFPVAFGGVDARYMEFPHMALLGYGTEGKIRFECGGSLISKEFVLTAAHCLESRQSEPVSVVRLGDLDIASDFDKTEPQSFNVVHTYHHPDYDFTTFYNDIALIKLDRPVTYTKYVKPACLQSEFRLKDIHMTATGWGALEFAGAAHSILQKVEIDSLPIKHCLPTYGPQDRLPRGIDEELQICGGNLQKRMDTCQGDSGGPLQVKIQYFPLTYKIAGVTSFGSNCGLVPGVYTRISKYISWIESVVWQNESNTS